MQILLINADLACPPNEIYAFRTFTLVANKFCHYEVLAEIEKWEFRDTYYSWFKTHYLFDHVKDIVPQGELGYKIYAPKLTLNNLRELLNKIGFK